MANDTAERIRALFEEAVELSPSKRSAFLRTRCAEDSEVRRRVETLLAHDVEAAGFLEPPGRAAEPDDLPPGARLGDYEILETLGSGGMGTVYRAAGARGPVALKVVHPHLLSSPGFFKRFLREAEIGKAVAHPNVVRCHDCDQLVVSGAPRNFLVMEYVEGRTLRDLLDELETVPEELCRHIGLEVAKGLGAIHTAGAVHRDLKPENVLITPDHEVKIMDLGVARLMDAAMRLSKSGAFVGSVLYAAPEQFKGGRTRIDGRADLFSLGVMLYELSSGVHPHPGEDFARVLARVMEEEPRRLGERNPQLSAFFEELVHTLLRKDPKERIPTARELLDILGAGEESTWWGRRARALLVQTKRPLRRIRIPRDTAVYGREEELAKLEALYETVRSGEGRVVLLEGEAGIGKTRIVDEFVRRLGERGEDPNFLFGSYPPSGAAAAHGGLSTAFREHFGEAGSAEHLKQTPLLVPAFDALLRGESAPKEALALTKESLPTCFVHAIRSLAAERPTILLVDDLHFAPEEARDVFLALALAVPGHRVLLIGTTRPGLPETWLANLTRLDHAQHAVLPRLGPKDLALLLKDSFRSERLAEELGYKIALKSDGNPFFVFEIIRGLREGQFITRQADGTWISTKVIEEIEIPSSVLDLVNARVAELEDHERNLLDIAACLGFQFDPGLVGDVLGIARIPALQAVAGIEKRHRLVRSAGREYVFDHHQVQEVLYGALNDQLREEYHVALAGALEARANAVEVDPENLVGSLCVDLCDHFLKGARGERARRYLDAALMELAANHLNEQAVDLADRVLEVPDLLVGVDRVKVLLRLGRADGPLHRLGRRDHHERAVREAVRLAEGAGDPEWCRDAVRTLVLVLRLTGRMEEAERVAIRALEYARATEDGRTEALSLSDLGIVLKQLGRLEESREHHEAATRLAREIDEGRAEAIALTNLGVTLHIMGLTEEARRRLGEAWELAGRIGYFRVEVAAMQSLGLVLMDLGRLEEARGLMERCLVVARERGDRHSVQGNLGNLGSLLRIRGELEGGFRLIEESLELSIQIGNLHGEAVANCSLGIVLLQLGRLPEAQVRLERSGALSREIGYRRGEALAHLNLANVLKEKGDEAKSQERTHRGLEISEECGFQDLRSSALAQLGALRVDMGDVPGGREMLSRALDSFAASGVIRAWALCHLAVLPGGDPEAAERALVSIWDSADTSEYSEMRWLLWKATGDRAHLEEAKRSLDGMLAQVDAGTAGEMLTNLRLNRDIMAAWAQHGGGE